MGMNDDDAALLTAARSDPAAFRELYERYATRVHGFHLRRTGSEEAALDLTAETFAQAWLSRARFRDRAGGSAAPWLFAIARHVLLRSVRRGRLERAACERLAIFEQLDREPSTATPQEAWIANLDPTLDELPPGQRDAVHMRVVEQRSYEDVAAALHTSPAAARVRVHRGLSTLRAKLAQAMSTEAPR